MARAKKEDIIKQPDPNEGLVLMQKHGEPDIAVHPTCVAAHKRAGWKVKAN